MSFYRSCIGGTLELQTIGETPLAERLPPPLKSCVLQATLTRGELVLLGSDMVDETGLIIGNAVSLVLNCGSAEEASSCYDKLSRAGNPTHPLEQTYWGALMGGLVDKYGHSWMVVVRGRRGKE